MIDHHCFHSGLQTLAECSDPLLFLIHCYPVLTLYSLWLIFVVTPYIIFTLGHVSYIIKTYGKLNN
jgi:hypothetical protein